MLMMTIKEMSVFQPSVANRIKIRQPSVILHGVKVCLRKLPFHSLFKFPLHMNTLHTIHKA